MTRCEIGVRSVTQLTCVLKRHVYEEFHGDETLFLLVPRWP
jgi:hypothetical protein